MIADIERVGVPNVHAPGVGVLGTNVHAAGVGVLGVDPVDVISISAEVALKNNMSQH